MRLLGFYISGPRWSKHGWWRWTVTLLGIGALCAAVWLGGPMTGWGPLVGVFWRAVLIALILGVDRLMDMIRTAVNITGDAVVSTIVAKSEGKLDIAVYNDPDAGASAGDLDIDPEAEARLAELAKG